MSMWEFGAVYIWHLGVIGDVALMVEIGSGFWQ